MIFEKVDEFLVVITWITLYYFVFEMESMRNKFESDTHEQHLQKHIKTSRDRNISIGCLCIFSFTSLIIMVILHINEKYDLLIIEVPDVLKYLDLVVTCFDIIVDFYVAVKLFSNLIYFINLKKTNLA